MDVLKIPLVEVLRAKLIQFSTHADHALNQVGHDLRVSRPGRIGLDLSAVNA